MKSLKLVSILCSVVILAMVSCKKGDTGPAGPQGPAGPDSVIYSNWITLNTPYNSTDSGYEQTITAASITQQVLDKGMILTYLNIPDNSGNAKVFPTSAVGGLVSETFSVGSIAIFSLADLTGVQYRYVILEGTIQGNQVESGPFKGYTKDQLKAMSYQDILKLGGQVGRANGN